MIIAGRVSQAPPSNSDLNRSQAQGANSRTGFPALLAERDGSDLAEPDYRQLGGKSAATSFAAMPIVAPAAIAMPASAAEKVIELNPTIDPAWPTAPSVVATIEASSPMVMTACSYRVAGCGGQATASDKAVGRGDPAQSLKTGASTASSQATGQFVQVAGNADAKSAKRGLIQTGPARSAAPSFEPGADSSVTVFAAVGEAQPRVIVRGGRMDAGERGETAARIVRLMREYGYRISEQSIDFEGGML